MTVVRQSEIIYSYTLCWFVYIPLQRIIIDRVRSVTRTVNKYGVSYPECLDKIPPGKAQIGWDEIF